MKTEEIFIENESIAINYIRKYEYPYMVLPNIKDIVLEIGEGLSSDYEEITDRVWVHKTATVSSNATISGPCIIDENAEIRTGAFIRGNVIIGKWAVLGNSCELKNAILFNKAKVPHFNYVGDSILGYNINMGAGSVTSNVKNDRTLVEIKSKESSIKTEIKKVGAFVGDNTEVGCNSVLNPGSVIGPNTFIYPLTSVRGVIPSNSIVKTMDNIVRKEER